MSEIAVRRPALPGVRLHVPLLVALNVLVWVQVSLQAARSLA